MHAVFHRIAGSQHKDVGWRLAQPQAPQHLEAIHIRQTDIEHDQIELGRTQRKVGALAGCFVIHRMAGVREHPDQAFGEQRIIFDDEDAHG